MKQFLRKELKYSARNYNPLNVCIKKAKDIFVTDINNKKYYDFLSGYSAVNQGHCHPRLINTVTSQINNVTLTSRAFHNNKYGNLCEYLCNTFDYEKFLPMNTGVEAGETAIKLSRKWGYETKNVEPNKAVNLFCNGNFWGRSITACSSSNDPKSYHNFGPYTQGIDLIDYNNVEQLENKLKENSNIVSLMVEPIQGEAGIIVPSPNYLKEIKRLCKKHNILLIFDEVQTGLGRTGKLLAGDYENVRPDILILGKSLTGGFYPGSGILSSDKIMSLFKPGQHGSTYGGNPLVSAIIMEAVKIIFDENLIENSFEQGKYFRKELKNMNLQNVVKIRGKGLFNALEFNDEKTAKKALDNLIRNGLLSQITHGKTIRLCPPLTITKNHINKSLEIIKKSVNKM